MLGARGRHEWLPENRRLRSQLVSVDLAPAGDIPRHSPTILLEISSSSPPPAFSLSLSLLPLLRRPLSASPLVFCCVQISRRPRKPVPISCAPVLSLFPPICTPLLSSRAPPPHSTPKYCNFSLVATTALQLRNDKFLARLPCLSLPSFLLPGFAQAVRYPGWCTIVLVPFGNHFVFPARLSSFAQLTRLTGLLAL